MPLAMGVIMLLLTLFMSGLYLDIAANRISSMQTGVVSERRATRQIHVGKVAVGGEPRSRCSR